MFGLIKTPPKESLAPVEVPTLADLQAGCVVGFGFMPQKAISGGRFPVSEVNSYLFDDDVFTAYRLESEGGDIDLIVADEGVAEGTYLALSLRIEPRLFESVFPDNPPEGWFALEEEDGVEAKPVVLGMQPGWLTSDYSVAVAARGRFLEGDYRLRMAADRVRLSRPIDYVLLLDEDNEYALEAEKYEDGTMNVFATVYRPATDIGEIVRAPRSPLASVEIIPHIAPTEVMKIVSPESVPEAPEEAATDADAVKTEMRTAPEPQVPAEENPVEAQKPAEIEKLPEAPKAVETEKPADAGKPVEAETHDAEAQAAISAIARAVMEEVPPPEEVAPVSAVAVPKSNSPAFVFSTLTAKEPTPAVTEPSITVPELNAATAEPTLAALEPVQSVTDIAVVTAEAVYVQEKTNTDMGTVLAFVPGIASGNNKESPLVLATAAREQEEAPPGTLACGLRLAWRLIDEAQRSQMPLSEVVRKVIDLPARVKEEVFIPFALDDAEIAELAQRYHLPATDVSGVKNQIIEELLRFVGEKK